METKEILSKKSKIYYLLSEMMGIRIKFVDCMLDRIDNRISYPEYVAFAGNHIQVIGSTNGYQDCPASSYERELGRQYDEVYTEIKEISDSGKVSDAGCIEDNFLWLPNVISFVDGTDVPAKILSQYYSLRDSALKKHEELLSKIDEMSDNNE